jgi:hypothetical protein
MLAARSPLANLSINRRAGQSPCRRRAGAVGVRSIAKRNTTQETKKKNVGRWFQHERRAFLSGLRIHGRGKWKKISKMIPTRQVILDHSTNVFSSNFSKSHMLSICVVHSFIVNRDTIQVKTHAQVMLKKFDDGQNIFEELDIYKRNESAIDQRPPRGRILSGREPVAQHDASDTIDAAQTLLLFAAAPTRKKSFAM